MLIFNETYTRRLVVIMTYSIITNTTNSYEKKYLPHDEHDTSSTTNSSVDWFSATTIIHE